MKLLLVCILGWFNVLTVSERLHEYFSERFPDANEVCWCHDQHNYIVYFRQANIRSTIYFDMDGNVEESIKYYTGSNLPLNIQWKMGDKFRDLNIFGVEEVSNAMGLFYYIHLENSSIMETIKSDGKGNLEEIEKFNKD